MYETKQKLDFNFGLLAPEVELHVSGAFPDLDLVDRGHDALRQLNEQLNAPWDRISLDADRLVDLGERVLALCQ